MLCFLVLCCVLLWQVRKTGPKEENKIKTNQLDKSSVISPSLARAFFFLPCFGPHCTFTSQLALVKEYFHDTMINLKILKVFFKRFLWFLISFLITMKVLEKTEFLKDCQVIISFWRKDFDFFGRFPTNYFSVFQDITLLTILLRVSKFR